MAPTIQEQCHRFLVENEERRCRAIEAHRRAVDGSEAKPVKRRVIPLPEVRPGPNGLCQESEFLFMVSELDYDLGDSAFLAYCAERGVLSSTATPGGKRWRYFLDTKTTWEKFSSDRNLRFAQSSENEGPHEFSEEELKFQWRLVTLGRAKLQDCWELFHEGKVAAESVL